MFESEHIIRGEDMRPTTVVLEPWGDVQALPAGESWSVLGRSEMEGTLEVHTSDAHVEIWAWPGATVTVLQNGHVVHDYPNPVPGLPDGVETTREFLDLVLGRSNEEESH